MASSRDDLTTSDASLVARLGAGDEQALAALYDRHASMAYGLALAIVHEAFDADEVVADTFAQIWRSAASFDAARGSVTAWIATITRSRSLDLLRAGRRRARAVERAVVASDTEVPLVAPTPLADRRAEESEARELVQRSLAALPPAQREVIELAYFGGLSQSEIADRLTQPLGTVKTRMRSGLEKLRQALGSVSGAAT